MSGFMSLPLLESLCGSPGRTPAGGKFFRARRRAHRSIGQYPRSGMVPSAALLQGPAASLRAVGGRRVLSVVARAQGGLLDLHQELDVVAGLLDLVDQQLDRLLRLEGREHPAQLDDDRQLIGSQEDLLLAGARGVDVDGREDALVRQPAVQLELRVTGALELLED